MLLANLCWTVAYDTAYAMVDRPTTKIGIRTSAITFGRHDVAAIMACHCAFLALMGAVGAKPGWARVVCQAGRCWRAGDGSIPHDPRGATASAALPLFGQ